MQRMMVGIVAAMLMVGVARAGTGSGAVTNITPIVLNGTEMFVVTLSTMNESPTCDGSSPRFALSASDPKYKSVMALLLGAYFSGASVFARGLGTCNLYSSAEDLSYVCLNGGVPC